MIKINKLALYSHSSGGTGNYGDELYEYFKNKNIKEIIKIDFPFDPKFSKTIRIRKYFNKKEVFKYESLVKFNSPMPLSYLKDIILGFYYALRYLKNTDLFIGNNNLLSSLGILLRKIGYTNKVYYVVIDFSPRRFKSNIFNNIYNWLDSYALYNSNTVFALNEEMLLAREKFRSIDLTKVNYFITPIGNNSCNRKDTDYELYDPDTFVYFGDILKSKGIELFIPIAKNLIKMGYKKFKFLIIGGGDVPYLKEEVSKNLLDEYFEITGRVDSHLEIENYLLKSSIAIAPYFSADKNSISYYADPGKVKNYLGCGLPVVITPVPPIYKIIEKEKAGVIVDYDAEKVAEALIKISENLKEYRKNAKKLGKYYDWNDIFDRYFNQDLK